MIIDRIAPTSRVAALLLALTAVAQVGCDSDEPPPGFGRRPVAIEALPAPVMKAAKKAIPRLDFREAWKNVDREGKVHSFEVRGRAANGKIREVRVSPEGAILEME